MAQDTVRLPDSLYKLSIAAVSDSYAIYQPFVRTLPQNIVFDIFYKLFLDNRLCLLNVELTDLDIFAILLEASNRKQELLKCFQALMDHGARIAKDLVALYGRKAQMAQQIQVPYDNIIDLGLRLGGFLSDAGWFAESEKVLLSCQELCKVEYQSNGSWRKLLECCHKLLHTQAVFCHFGEAKATYTLALEIVDRLESSQENVNLAGLFAEFSVLHFCRSEYDEAYRWSIRSIKQLKSDLPARIRVDILRQAAKSCVIKREFDKAGLLARQAVCLVKESYDSDHLKYSDALLDYGFYLLNFDCIRQCVTVYQMALDIRRALFGERNLQVAIAYEELAYALYVFEYSSGRFLQAQDHIDRAIAIMEKLLPQNHLMLASVKRVKALILEEIALDNMANQSGMTTLLSSAEELHLAALKLAVLTFGEKNVQTAKHYGNLGRLYQSMKKYQEAEMMHLRAIHIKEELLGSDDYEVGLSIGHLASLYNYHMKKYARAEQLYLRSIVIGLKLFGKSYSGLEYDYRGLIHVYRELNDVEKVAEYTYILNNWKLHRDLQAGHEDLPINLDEPMESVEVITNKFFNTN